MPSSLGPGRALGGALLEAQERLSEDLLRWCAVPGKQ